MNVAPTPAGSFLDQHPAIGPIAVTTGILGAAGHTVLKGSRGGAGLALAAGTALGVPIGMALTGGDSNVVRISTLGALVGGMGAAAGATSVGLTRPVGGMWGALAGASLGALVAMQA